MEKPRDPEASDAQEAEEEHAPQSAASAAEEAAGEEAPQAAVSHNPPV
ncbi:hypothetical protein [Hymenobacter sp. PAMC 26628]|nr:hypothetical protein [Hymenobacter sp. PAMC 26628]